MRVASAVASLSRTEVTVGCPCPAMDGRLRPPSTGVAIASGGDPSGVPLAMSEPQDSASESWNEPRSATVPVWIELVQELVAPIGLVDLADAVGHGPQSIERPQEPAVGRVAPPHVS